MRLGRSAALARYALACNARTPYTWAGAALFLALALLGLYASARRGDGWTVDASLVFDGGLLAAVFGVRSGLIVQRVGGLQTYLRTNFMTPVEHMAGAITSLVASWLTVCAAIFAASWLLPGGGLEAAAWNATVFAVRTGVLLPFVIPAESVTTIEIPFFLPGLAYFGVLITLVFVLGELEALRLLAPPMQRGDWASAVPGALRVAIALPAGFGAVLLVTRWRNRR
ncbi:MAG: hypothetical protein ACN0LA_07810 [Candidatus Longimicrobiales bacterium M2_2A_002]